MDFLQDSAFLYKLNHNKVKEFWAAIMVLDFATERPVQRIEGKVTGGSINISASSPTRRTGSLTIVFDEKFRDLTNVTNLVAIDKKIALSVGMTNPFYHTKEYREYGDVLWFKQGTFIITKASSSVSTTSSSISINFVDKMAMLNGVCGGTLPATVSFHEKLIEEENGMIKTDYPLISEIIFEAVHHFGGEHPSRIMITDVDPVGRQVLTYQGTTPINFSTYNDMYDEAHPIHGGNFVIQEPPVPGYGKTYYKGDIVGYLETPLTYPGELILKAGATVTQVLDAIVDALGNFEYFYDVEGTFHFQKKRNYVQTGNAPLNFDALSNGALAENGDISLHMDDRLQMGYLPQFQADAYLNEFADTSLVTQVQFSPAYDKIKNDFIVWGTRNSNEENAQIVRYHLAIDQRPVDSEDALCHKDIWVVYKPTVKVANTTEGEEKGDDEVTEGQKDAIIVRYQLLENVTKEEEALGYWAEKYCRSLDKCFPSFENEKWYWFNWREELYRMALLDYGASTDTYMNDQSGVSSWAYYYEELRAEWRAIYDPENNYTNKGIDSFQSKWDEKFSKSNGNRWFGYNVDVAVNPSNLRYWLDILDSAGTIGQFSIQRIGRRTVAKENSKINEVFQHVINDVIFIDQTDKSWDYAVSRSDVGESLADRIAYYNSIGQTFSLLSAAQRPYFKIINSYGTCYEDIRELLYTNLVYNSSVSLTSIPLFYLDVNKILRLNFADLKIQGDYVINQISWQLGKTPTMTLSLQEALVVS